MSDVFDIFEPPRAKRQQSEREKEQDAKVSYRKYHTKSSIPCRDCVGEYQVGLSKEVRKAIIVRREGENEAYLCGRHAQDRRDRETLNIPKERKKHG